jgi:hypothetical protein
MAKKAKTVTLNTDGQKKVKDGERELTVQEKKLMDYLEAKAAKDATVAKDLKRTDKSIDGLMEYVGKRAFSEMDKAATQIKTSKGTGGFFNDDEVVGWAMHYYHESNEDIEAEFKKDAPKAKSPNVKMKTDKKATVQLDENTEILFDLF